MGRMAMIEKHPTYLEITLTTDGREEIADVLADDKISADGKLATVLEYELGNGWELLPHGIAPDEVGGLTEAPMLSDETAHDEYTNAFTHIGRIYWFPDYAVRDPVEVLARDGVVRFPLGEDMSAQFSELAQLRKLASAMAAAFQEMLAAPHSTAYVGSFIKAAEQAQRVVDQFGPYDPYGEKEEVAR